MTRKYLEAADLSPCDGYAISILDSNNGAQILDALSVMPSDAFFLIVPECARIREDIFDVLNVARECRPDVDIFYADEAVHSPRENTTTHFCKPELNLSLLIAYDYVGFPLIIRCGILRRLLNGCGKITHTSLYKIPLQCANLGIVFKRIAEVLVINERARPHASLPDRIAILDEEFRKSASSFYFCKGMTDDSVRMNRVFQTYPPVTLVIPTNRSANKASGDSRPLILDLLESLVGVTWPMDKLTVLIGDDKGAGEIYDGREWPFKLKVVDTHRGNAPFNYAKKMNSLWALCETENIIFMNDDIVVDDRDFIEALLTFSIESGVGGAGARLKFPSGKLQHAGMVGGIFEVFAHPWYAQSADCLTYGDWAAVHRDCSAVTGAVFATRRSVLEEINGFDEFFALDFNDTDMCLRMKALGYRIIYTPFATLTHNESASRAGHVTPGEQIMRFLTKWRDAIKNDPMYNSNLSRNQDNVVCHLDS